MLKELIIIINEINKYIDKMSYAPVVDNPKKDLVKILKKVNKWGDILKIKLKLINLKTLQIFEKEFDTEFEKDKFKRKLRYSKKLKVVEDVNVY